MGPKVLPGSICKIAYFGTCLQVKLCFVDCSVSMDFSVIRGAMSKLQLLINSVLE